MAKETVGNDREHYEGPDKPFYENSGGRLVPSPSYANDDGFGTPPDPGVRGEAFGGHHSHGDRTPKANPVVGRFFTRKGKS